MWGTIMKLLKGKDGKAMNNTITSPVIREYEIDGVKYIVSASTKAGAKENATSKIRRLIRGEITKFV